MPACAFNFINFSFFSPAMINYDEKMVLNSRLVIKMGIDQIGKIFVKSMSVKKFSYLGQFIQGLRTPDIYARKTKNRDLEETPF